MIEIKHRYTDAVICSFDVETVKEAVVMAVVSCADLSGADLSRADLSSAYLSGAYLSGANLYGANLSCANLSGANLSGANLSSAYLSGADLSRAYLSRAYLSRADLSGANLSGEKLAIAPISILNLHWGVLITESYLTIGCKRYLHTKWKEFDMDTIAKMSENAAEFWQQWKSPLLAMCKAHRVESLKARKEQS